MHRFQVLGRIDLRDANGNELRGVLAQPKRLALAAYLCVNGAHGPVRRDKLLALFWPELDQERARKALNKAVHFLRQELGDTAVTSRSSEELEVDRTQLWSDAAAFGDALKSDRPGDALEYYGGELLPAFHVDDAPAFDEWLEQERSKLRRLAAHAAHLLAERREREGQFTTAVAFARRAVELSDEDERTVRQLLELLERLGDRAGALYAYEKFARRMATEFDAQPAAETQALIARVRARVDVEPAPGVRNVYPTESVPGSYESLSSVFRRRGYEIERELGRGGMATVYLARDVKHDRRVAIKVLSPEIGALRLADRFAAEIRVTANLQHPNILPLFDSGEVQGTLYYAMPFIEGESLRARLDRERQLPVEEAIALVRTLAAALDFAHKKGVIHRDIKPENILLQDGQPLLADFGIALALSSASVERITATGLSLGTPQYMSPEQAAGELAVGPSSDIYSLAAVAYEMFTGQPPFTGPNVRAVLAKVMLEAPQGIRAARNAVPERVDAAILKALAKHPADRFASGAEFGLAMVSGVQRKRRLRELLTSRVAMAAAAVLVALASIPATRAGPALGALLGRANLLPGVTHNRLVLVADFDYSAVAPATAATAREIVASVLDRSGIVSAIRPDQLLEVRRAAMLSDSAALVAERARHVAYRSNAYALIEGRIAPAGVGEYSVILRATDATSGRPIASADSIARGDGVALTVERLTRRIAPALRQPADTEGLGTREIGKEGRIATPSLEAYKKLLQSYEFARRGTARLSALRAREALALDPDFADAWAWLGQQYAGWYDDSARFAYDQAWRRSERFSKTYKLAIEAEIARLNGDPLTSARKYGEALLESPPNAASMQMEQGYNLQSLGDYEGSVKSYESGVALTPAGQSPVRRLVLANAYIALGRFDDARSIQRKLPENLRSILVDQVMPIAEGRWDDVEKAMAAEEAEITRDSASRANAALQLASAQAVRGRITDAYRSIHRGATHVGEFGALIDVYQLLLNLASGQPLPADAIKSIKSNEATRLYRIAPGLWQAQTGDTVAAGRELRAARSAVRYASDPGGRDVDLLEAWIAARSQRWPDVVRILGGNAWRGAPGEWAGIGWTARNGYGGLSLNFRRWMVADAYEHLNRPDSAAAYFELLAQPTRIRMDERMSSGLVLSFAHQRLAQLYTRMGEAKRARSHWSAFLDNLTQPDSALRPLVDEVRHALTPATKTSAVAHTSSVIARLGNLVASFRKSDSAAGAADVTWLLVADFEGPKNDRALGVTVRELVNSVLAQSAALVPVARDQLREARRAAMIADSAVLTSERARHLAARTAVRTVIEGRIDRLGTNYVLVIRAIDVNDGRTIASAQGSATEGTLATTIEDLSRQVSAKLGGRSGRAGPSQWVASTKSFEAYRLWAQATERGDQGDVRGTIRLANQAVALDPGFSVAWSLLAAAYRQVPDRDSVHYATQQALRHIDRLSAAERYALLAQDAYQSGKRDSAVRMYDAAIRESPSNALFYHDRGMALRLLGRWDESIASFKRATELVPLVASPSHLNSLATTLAMNGRVDEARQVADRISAPMQRKDADLFIAIGAADWDEAKRIAASIVADPTETISYRGVAVRMIAASQAARGQLVAARQTLIRGEAEYGLSIPRAMDEMLMNVASGARTPPVASAADSMPWHSYARAAWHAWRRDSARTALEISAMRRYAKLPGHAFLLPEIALFDGWIASGDAGQRKLIEFFGPEAWDGRETGRMNTIVPPRWFVADAYEKLGRLDSAAAYFELLVRPARMYFGHADALGFAHPFALRRLALLYERMGRRDLARPNWRQFVNTFTNPDPELMPMVAEARAALARRR